MRNVIACIGAALGFACATAQKPPVMVYVPNHLAKGGTEVASTDSKRKIICKYEMGTGSHIPEKTCRYGDEVDDQRRETQDMIRGYVPPNLRTDDKARADPRTSR
jgi:hypothetical protein